VQRLTIPASLSLVLLLAAVLPGPAVADKSTVVTLYTAGAVTSPPSIDYRWADIGQNSYAQTYQDTFTYDAPIVTVSFETGEPTFTGHISGTNLKPNFAYQLKIVGKPTGIWGIDGDDVSNENIGYAGRWWQVEPAPPHNLNSSPAANDAYYNLHKDDPAYIFEAYLLFDFFLTDPDGNVDLDFALDSSYHVLFGDWQGGGAGGCNQPLKTTTVSGLATDPAYDTDVGPTLVGVYPQIERECWGTTTLPQGPYLCRVLLTEESFHTSDGNWAPAMIHDDIQFTIGEGLFPPTIHTEPAYTAGTDNTISWNTVSGATQYFAECSTASNFSSILADSDWIGLLSHTFTGLPEGQILYYRVKSSDGTKAESAWSTVVSSTQDATAPASSVDALPASHTGSSLSIPYTASDATSGVDHATLHYRVGGGAYLQYGGTHASSPINFVIPGDGDYDFYTVATDVAGNAEAAPGTPDASCALTVGTTPDPVGNPDYIDIGTLASEGQAAMGDPPHNMVGWGPSEPDTHGGNYGSIAPGSCRPIWSPTEFDQTTGPERWADIDLNFGPSGGDKTLWLRHLDGASPDSFDVFIDGTYIETIDDVTSSETWFWADIDVTGYTDTHTVRLESTGPPGTHYNPYGQVCLDIISICDAAALFAALPADAGPIDCAGSKSVAFHFTRGCEYVRGYTLRVSSADGLAFDDGDVIVYDPSGTGDVTSSVTQNDANDWTVTYAINGDSALPTGIPSDVDLFTVVFQGAIDGAGLVVVESVSVDPLWLVPPPVLNSLGTSVTVDCTAPTGGFQVNGGAASTNDLAVVLDSAVSDATALQMRFVNDPDPWPGPEEGWTDYAATHFWSLASGPDGTRTVRSQYRDAVGLVTETVDMIDYVTNGPTAVTALNATRGHRKTVVTWDDPPDGDIVRMEVWRGLWYDDDAGGASAYPEYGGLPNDAVPTRPTTRAGALASPEWEHAGSVLPGDESFTDQNGPLGLDRGIYYYEVFAENTDNYFGPAAAANDCATSYLLGDLDGDGAISIGPDINTGLSLCYGTGDGDTGYDNDCDVGPTDDYGGGGIPQPDDSIDFADLMVFALNFDTVLAKESDDPTAIVRFVWTEIEPDVWSLGLVEPCADLKGLNLTLDLPAGSVRSLSAGALLAGQDCPHFLDNIDSRGLDVGLALLSDGARIRGAGELLRVAFTDGCDARDPGLDVRDSRNATLPNTVETVPAAPEAPVLHRAFPNHPNPFNPATRIEFELPVAETVELSVYRLDGRRVVTLAQGLLPAGRHVATWTGRDAHGEPVASGTYIYRLKAGTYTKTCKMTLLK